MSSVAIGSEIELVIDGLASGSGVGRLDGRVCFVEGALPGERVRACVQEIKKRYLKAALVDVLEKSPHRENPPCPYVSECGGCQYQHVSYPEELRWKEDEVRQTLKRIGRVEPEHFEPITASPEPYGYRKSITLQQGELGRQRAWGFYARDNVSIVPIERCLIADDKINAAISKRLGREAYRTFSSVSLRLASGGEVVDDTEETFYKTEILGQSLWASSRGFFQTNTAVTERMVEKIRAWLGPLDRFELYDLYAGVGLFACLIGQKATRVTAVEANESSVAALRRNVGAVPQGTYRIVTGAVEKKIAKLLGEPSDGPRVVIVDPPREGLHPDVVKCLAESRIDSIIYVSCDAASLARDLGGIMGTGNSVNRPYKFVSVAPFDMFPRTKHIEIAAYLKAIS